MPLIGVDRIFAQQGSDAVFRHGVASGDPLRDRVVLWTRVTPGAPETTVDVELDGRARRADVAGDRARRGADVRGARLHRQGGRRRRSSPGSTYYYRFAARGARSPVGRTRTLPARPTSRLRLALVSCSNLPFGFFNVYNRVAARPDLDAVLHLGDYIYEYRNNDYGHRPEGDGRPFGRVPFPDREIVSLDDYRARYAQYREDVDLQAAHRQHPFIVVWDDHETANNSWQRRRGESQSGRRRRGRRAARRPRRAWREWMPVREAPGAEFRMYRQFAFGDLADLMMLDTRIEGRDQQVAARGRRGHRARVAAAARHGAGRVAVGQPARFHRRRQAVADPRPAGDVRAADAALAPPPATATPGTAIAAPAAACSRPSPAPASSIWWCSPATCTARGPTISRAIRSTAPPTIRRTGKGAMGTEIIAPAVTSPGGPPPDRVAGLLDTRPHLKYVVGQQRGYVVLDVTRDRLQADWWYVPTITERSEAETFGKGMTSSAAAPHLVEASGPASARPGADFAP